MYRCRMKIAVFSKDTMLYELVRSLEPLEHFTHEITVAPEANQEIMRESRLIIWNLDDPVPPSVLRSQAHRLHTPLKWDTEGAVNTSIYFPR